MARQPSGSCAAVRYFAGRLVFGAGSVHAYAYACDVQMCSGQCDVFGERVKYV